MLKIKDEVNLKELEKFGYKLDNWGLLGKGYIKFLPYSQDEWNPYYEKYKETDVATYERINYEIENYKSEGFYLLKKYFFHLWW